MTIFNSCDFPIYITMYFLFTCDLRCLRGMELSHLVSGGSNKSQLLLDKKTFMRLFTALDREISTKHGNKTKHKVRIVSIQTDACFIKYLYDRLRISQEVVIQTTTNV